MCVCGCFLSRRTSLYVRPRKSVDKLMYLGKNKSSAKVMSTQRSTYVCMCVCVCVYLCECLLICNYVVIDSKHSLCLF